MSDYVSNTNLTDIASALRSAERIVLTAHAKPDGDAIGAVLALSNPDEVPDFASASLAMRSLTVQAEAGGVLLQLPEAGIAVYDQEGQLIFDGQELGAERLPATLYLDGLAAGADASLVATHSREGCEDVQDSLRLRVAALPGPAGQPLDRFPHFSFVDAFNHDGTVWAALDATRFPDRVGHQAQVHVVEHKEPAAWTADATLQDVTGQVESFTLLEGSLAGNQVAAWTVDATPDQTASYDLVLDFDGDGSLSPGDLIDGLSDLAPGLRVFADLTQSGPHGVEMESYSGGSWLGQQLYHPSDIADLSDVPIVVISHGNGHNYTWYAYLGMHLASHGYVVMSHQNNTGPGIETASTTTLTNTDYLLGNLDSIAGGALQGHVDIGRIVWIGHSRGGEGVVRAYDRLRDGVYTPFNYSADDIALISSIAPTVFNSVLDSNPHDVTFHLLGGAADGDVNGSVDCSQCQFLRIAAAATGDLQVTYVQGAGHNDFNCCGWNDATGPDTIGRDEAQTVAKGYYLALLQHYMGGDAQAGEYLQRMYDDLHPTGIADSTVVAGVFRRAAVEDKLVLDDHQSQLDPALSSAGAVVAWDLDEVAMDILDDANTNFTWSEMDPMNGMTWAEERDDVDAGRVFEWAQGQEAWIEWEVPLELADWSDYAFLSFRACQGTRHPNTLALDAPLDFTVTIVDGAGVESSIGFGAWGGLTSPYKRTGGGQGAGWANEFETVRIPLQGFETDGSTIDLSDIAAVRFELGEVFGSAQGRVGIDDLEVTR